MVKFNVATECMMQELIGKMITLGYDLGFQIAKTVQTDFSGEKYREARTFHIAQAMDQQGFAIADKICGKPVFDGAKLATKELLEKTAKEFEEFDDKKEGE
jgi:hypothetical protein